MEGRRRIFWNMVPFKIEQLPANWKKEVDNFLRENPETPAARFRPDMAVMRHLWLAFVGPVFRDTSTGIGKTPLQALADFNRHFRESVYPGDERTSIATAVSTAEEMPTSTAGPTWRGYSRTPHPLRIEEKERKRMRLLLLIILVLLIIGALPAWPYSTGWGYYPSGGLGLLLVIIVLLVFLR
jgi:Protein of unknown function (DUF3309)